MAFDPITALLSVGEKVIDKIFPDANQAAKAKLELAQMAQNGEFKELEAAMSILIAEAQSADKWTSRARPSFLYVVYLMILMGIPMGLVSAWRPDIATAIGVGLASWLNAIPDAVWSLFGLGYLGYVGSRTWDKTQLLKWKK
jgi:hypothetical protein